MIVISQILGIYFFIGTLKRILHVLHSLVVKSSFDDLNTMSFEPHLGQEFPEGLVLNITTGPVIEQFKTKNFLNIITASGLVTIILVIYKYIMFIHMHLNIKVKNRTITTYIIRNLIISDYLSPKIGINLGFIVIYEKIVFEYMEKQNKFSIQFYLWYLNEEYSFVNLLIE